MHPVMEAAACCAAWHTASSSAPSFMQRCTSRLHMQGIFRAGILEAAVSTSRCSTVVP